MVAAAGGYSYPANGTGSTMCCGGCYEEQEGGCLLFFSKLIPAGHAMMTFDKDDVIPLWDIGQCLDFIDNNHHFLGKIMDIHQDDTGWIIRFRRPCEEIRRNAVFIPDGEEIKHTPELIDHLWDDIIVPALKNIEVVQEGGTLDVQ